MQVKCTQKLKYHNHFFLCRDVDVRVAMKSLTESIFPFARFETMLRCAQLVPESPE